VEKHPELYAELAMEEELPMVCKSKVVIHVFVAFWEECAVKNPIVVHI